MKNNCISFMAILIALSMSSCRCNGIKLRINSSNSTQRNATKGDGNIITKQIDVTTFDKIELTGAMQVDYSQSDGAPLLIVKVDQNIYDIYSFTVKERTLCICPKPNYSNIQPTSFKVTMQSDRLHDVDVVGSSVVNLLGSIASSGLDIDIAGSGRVVVNEALNIESLDVSIAGSGKVTGNKALNVESLDVGIAGSGGFKAKMVKTNDLDVEIAGSGLVSLGGSANSADYSISGSGRIDAFGLQVPRCDVSITGSGTAYVFVSKVLNADISGSGRVDYRGSATLSKSISGSGRVNKVE